MMFFKSIAFLLVASKASGLKLNGGFFDNDAVEESPEGDMTPPDAMPQPPPDDMPQPPLEEDERGEDLPDPVSPPDDGDEGDEPPDEGDDGFNRPEPPLPPPVLPPPEDPKGAFIFYISTDAQLDQIIDDFMANNSQATLKGTYTAEPFGFSVEGVTEAEVKMFANSCSNLVLDIFKLFQASDGGGAVGDEGNGCVARPPSGTITMSVVYDTFAYETHFSLWKLEDKAWVSMHEYPPPNTYPQTKQDATVQLEDGTYSFDIVDMAHNGIATQQPDGYYTQGHFTITETDSGKQIYKGADFGTYLSVEFDITNGEATLSNVKNLQAMNNGMGWYY